MRKIFAGCLMSVGLTTAVFAAGVAAPPKVEQALKRALPNAKWTVEDGNRTINGVNVFDVEVTNKFGRSVVTITDNGDFLISGVPTNPDRMPAPVKHVIDHLFKKSPPTVERYENTVYIVGITTAGRESGVFFDAVGRIVDIKSIEELRHTEQQFNAEGEETDPGVHQKMEALCTRMEDKGQIQHIFKNPDFPNFYVVVMTNEAGKQVTYVTNGEEVFARKVVIDEQELPPAVERALHADFAADTITGIARRRYEYYQFDQPCASGDVLRLRIDADGKILTASSRGSETEAEEAKKKAGH